MVPTPASGGLPAELKRIGRYKIVRPLSKGGMALVYEARRESLAGVMPRVAIKVILPEHQDSKTFRDLFINEARLGASMQHQNLVQIQDFDSEGERFFLVMEYVEGLTLRRIISLADRYGLKMPMGVIAEMGRQACDGLHHAHGATDERGDHLMLVHRDIKPSNLILNPHGVVKVLDFGISKGALREERKGSVKGTWGYMAPEQATGRGVTPVSDVFGLAVVLYELAALRPMFREKGKEDIKRLLADDHAARMAATLDADYGPLVRVLIRALQRDPEARFANAEELSRALSALLPDPITARDEVVRFYQQMEALHKDPQRSTAVPPEASQGSILVPDTSPEVDNEPSVLGWILTGVAVLTVTVGLLAAIVGVGAVLLVEPVNTARYSDGPSLSDVMPEPAGPAGEDAPGEERVASPKPAPFRGTPGIPPVEKQISPPEEVDPNAPVRVRVVRSDGPQPIEAPTPPVSDADLLNEAAPLTPQPGTSGKGDETTTGAIVIAAKQAAEIYIGGQFVGVAPLKKRLDPGRYAISIVAEDGRRRSFEVDVEVGQKIRKTWDFDRNSWR
ncbi:MAG: protein kinase [Rhodobacterales bacterium]|nr:protein kinase [Rhodobacterales bacterium]